MEIRVAIVEDLEDVRDGLAFLIGSAAGFHCAGAYTDAETAIEQIEIAEPDVMLMDIGLPGMDGIQATRLVRRARPRTQVMMLTVYEDDARIFESLRAGATGYVLKKTPPATLLEWIGVMHRGGSPISSQIARRVIETFHRPALADPTADLTPREREILELLVRGYRYGEIGDRLFISLDTVRTHIRHIYEKMHVRSRGEAAARYHGLRD